MSPPLKLPSQVVSLIPLLPDDTPVWLVGGAVRDLLLGFYTTDLDFVVDGDAIRVARRIANHLGGDYYTLDRERETGRVILREGVPEQVTFDIARMRGEDIQEDLRRRDFTINALAVSLTDPPEWIDPTGGAGDLKDKQLRACSAQSLLDDPARSLRAVRFGLVFDLQITPETIRQVREAGPKLGTISPERLRDEMMKLLGIREPGRAIRLLDHLDLIEYLFPEIIPLHDLRQPPPHAYDGFEHTIAVMNRLDGLLTLLGPKHDPEGAADLLLAQASLRLGRYRERLNAHFERKLRTGNRVCHLLNLAALYHDSGKPSTLGIEADGRIRFFGHARVGAELVEARARALHFSNQEIQDLKCIVENHMRPGFLQESLPLTRRAIYRFFRDTAEKGIDVVMLSLADFLGTYTPPAPQDDWSARIDVARTLLEAYFDQREQCIDPVPLLRGDEVLLELGLTPGPNLGRILKSTLEAQAAGEIQTRAQALDLARKLAETGEPSENQGDDD
jgi:tRNA nucleotidyltransferase/poly(A) polymerase